MTAPNDTRAGAAIGPDVETNDDYLSPTIYGVTVSRYGYGWTLHLGKRVRWHSRKATTPMWPHLSRGADEHCNRSISAHLWPLGHLDVHWEPHWRSSECDTCKADADAHPVALVRRRYEDFTSAEQAAQDERDGMAAEYDDCGDDDE